MQAVGAKPTSTRASRALIRQRVQVLVALAVFAAVGVLTLLPTATTVAGPGAATSTTVPGPVIVLAQFPVQGKCSFIDTYGAPRSGGRSHEGVDIIAKSGKYVYAVNDGTLTKQYVDQAGSLSGNGWKLTTSDGTYYFYAHLSGFPPGLKLGDKVSAGQIIGYVGETGNAGTPHLHFEIHPQGGEPVNPTQSVIAVDGCEVTTPPAAHAAPVGVPTANLAVAVRGGTPVDPTAPTTPTTTPTTPTTTPTTPTAPSGPEPDGGSGGSPPATWVFVEPAVVFNGPAVANVTRRVRVEGGALSASTAGVLVRVSATAINAGSMVVHPCDEAVPIATTLFAEPGPLATTSAPVKVVGGEFCLTSGVDANVKLTVIGQLGSAGANPLPIQPTRPLDSRQTGRLAPNVVSTLAPSTFGAMAATKGVTATFTVLNPSAAGTLMVGPCGGTALSAPFANTPIAAFSAIVPVSVTGMCVSSTVAVDVIVDVDALWNSDALAVAPVTTRRVFDSRDTGEVWSSPVPIVIGSLDGGKQNASIAVVNVTVLAGAAGGSVFVWNCEKQPAAAVALAAANKRATFAVVTSLTDGRLCVSANQQVHVIVDVAAAA